jgi:hypothetical protein
MDKVQKYNNCNLLQMDEYKPSRYTASQSHRVEMEAPTAA